MDGVRQNTVFVVLLPLLLAFLLNSRLSSRQPVAKNEATEHLANEQQNNDNRWQPQGGGALAAAIAHAVVASAEQHSILA